MKRLIIMTLLTCIGFSSPLFAKGNKDSLPNGKPFQNIQNQIDIINLSLAEQKMVFEARFAQVESDASELAARVAANEADIEALEAYNEIQDSYAVGLQAAIDMLSARVDDTEEGLAAAELRDQYHDLLIDNLTMRYQSLSTYAERHITALWSRFNVLNNLVYQLTSRVSTLERRSSSQGSLINSLLQFKETYTSELIALDQLLNTYCGHGKVMAGIREYGYVECTEVEEFNGITVYMRWANLGRFSFCDTDIFGECIDTDYYQNGSVYCSYNERISGGGFELNGSAAGKSYPLGRSAWYVSAFATENQQSAGKVWAMCLGTN